MSLQFRVADVRNPYKEDADPMLNLLHAALVALSALRARQEPGVCAVGHGGDVDMS
jgi:hypothetical protein